MSHLATSPGKALPFNRDIFAVVGLRQIALLCKRSVATGRTPVPICNPEVRWFVRKTVPPAGEWFDTADFKHRALTLKTVGTDVCQVVGMTSILVCWASRPVLAIHNELS